MDFIDKLEKRMGIKQKIYTTNEQFKTKPFWIRWSVGLIGLILLVMGAVGIYWSREPDLIDTSTEIQRHLKDGKVPTGIASSVVLKSLMQELLYKPGGFLSNDASPPGMYLDNITSFEYGAIFQIRDFTRAFRKDFSRSQTQSSDDEDLKIAENKFNVDVKSWAFPAAEGEYEEGIRSLDKYIGRLNTGNANFYARADNLYSWLGDVESRLGSLSLNLSQSVGLAGIDTTTIGTETEGTDTTDSMTKTSWFKLDDVFYEARGQTWALIHLLKAVETDFQDVLIKKNALISLRQIIRELEASQAAIWSPIILNGSGYGILANHSLTLANYISRATAGIAGLRQLLKNG